MLALQQKQSTLWTSFETRCAALVFMCVLFSLLHGCSTSKASMQNNTVPTMKKMYQQKFQKGPGLTREDVERLDKKHDAKTSALGESVEPLQTTFRYLSNPTLIMFVTPHLTDAGTPIPGYATYFKLYERSHVALPHEPSEEH